MAVPLLQGSTFTVANPATERISCTASRHDTSAQPALLCRQIARVHGLSKWKIPLLPSACRKLRVISPVNISDIQGKSHVPGEVDICTSSSTQPIAESNRYILSRPRSCPTSPPRDRVDETDANACRSCHVAPAAYSERARSCCLPARP